MSTTITLDEFEMTWSEEARQRSVETRAANRKAQAEHRAEEDKRINTGKQDVHETLTQRGFQATNFDRPAGTTGYYTKEGKGGAKATASVNLSRWGSVDHWGLTISKPSGGGLRIGSVSGTSHQDLRDAIDRYAKAWSEEARQASLQARAARAKQRQEDITRTGHYTRSGRSALPPPRNPREATQRQEEQRRGLPTGTLTGVKSKSMKDEWYSVRNSIASQRVVEGLRKQKMPEHVLAVKTGKISQEEYKRRKKEKEGKNEDR